MAEPSGRLNSMILIHESTETENKVLDLLIKNGCSNEDLLNVSSMLQTIYMCGFEVGKEYVPEQNETLDSLMEMPKEEETYADDAEEMEFYDTVKDNIHNFIEEAGL